MPTSAFHPLPLLPLTLCLALAPAVAGAQGAGKPAASPASHAVGAASVGLRATPDGFRGGGPDYRVELGAGGMRFTPALGRGAERTFPVAFELAGVSVGGVELPCAEALPEACGTEVVYRRGGGLTERYELTAAGVEQSFVFETLPAGRGDVVVRGRLSTELDLVAADERTGLVLERAGLGGVRYGGVTGIDAEGRAAPGWLRLADGVLELGLPADFVAGAALPLVLDPLVTPLITLNDGAPDDEDVDVAFDEVGGYLVVWTRTFSGGDTEIRGQLLNEDGSLDGGLILISESDQNRLPAAGSFPSEHAFLVAWEHRSASKPDADVHVCAVDELGTVSAETPVGVTDQDELEPDVGQSWIYSPVVWRNSGTGIKGASIELDAFDDPTVSQLYTLSTNPVDRSPALSASDSTETFVVWHRDNAVGPDGIWGRHWFGGYPTEAEFLVHASLGTISSPACAQGEEDDDYMVVWAGVPPFTSAPFDIYGARVTYPGNDPVVGSSFLIEKDALEDETSPDIAYAKHEYIVAFLASAGAISSVDAVAIDAMSGARLEQMSVAGPGKLAAPALAGVADPSSSGAGLLDGVLIAWNDVGSPAGGDVFAALAEGFGGTQGDLWGSGCPGTGEPRASAYHSPNTGHRQELWNAPEGLDAILGIGWTPFSLPLGDTTLHIDPAQSLAIYAGTVDPDGFVGVKVPIPSGLSGVSLWTQWALIPAEVPCTSLGVDLTDAIQAVLE